MSRTRGNCPPRTTGLWDRAKRMSVCISPASIQEAVIPVSVATLIPETVPAVSLYISDGTESSYRLYRGPEHLVTAADIGNLRSRGVSNLYVAGDDYRRY